MPRRLVNVGVVLSLLLLLLPGPTSADDGNITGYIKQAVLYTQQAISYVKGNGQGGNAGFLQRYIEAALIQVRAADKIAAEQKLTANVQPNRYIAEAISHLNAASAEAKDGFIDTATFHAQEALKLLQEVSPQ